MAFYHLGLGKGLLLDRPMPDWKTRYFAPGVWLDDLVFAALGQPDEVPAVTVGAVAPNFNLTDTAGRAVSLSQYRGIAFPFLRQRGCRQALHFRPYLSIFRPVCRYLFSR